MAPLAPLVAEEVWRGLTGGRSVHLTDWPELPETVADPDLVAAMDEVRAVVSATHALRKANRLRVRLPLRTLRVVTAHPRLLEPFTALIASEVNVKEVVLVDPAGSGLTVREELTLLPRTLTGEVRKLTSKLFGAVRAGQWERVEAGVRFPGVTLDGNPVVLDEGQYTLTTAVDAEEGSVAAVLESGAFVVLDTTVDEELEAEGYARDLVRLVQDARKEAGLHVADRIELTVVLPATRMGWVQAHEEMVCRETLTVELTTRVGPELAIERLAKVEA